MSRDYSAREQSHVDRDDDVVAKNNGATSFHASIGLLQEIPGVEIEFGNDMLSWLRVRRQGITYGINKRTGPSTGGKHGRYVFALGADLGDGLVFPVKRGNCFGSYVEAVNALYKCILHDPRQTEIPRPIRATHVVVKTPVCPGP